MNLAPFVFAGTLLTLAGQEGSAFLEDTPPPSEDLGDFLPDVTAGAAPVDEQAGPDVPLLDGRPADVRLVITGGLDGLHDGYPGFFRAGVFESDVGLPIVVDDAARSAVRSSEGLFFTTTGSLGTDVLRKAQRVDTASRALFRAFFGPQAIAIAPGEGQTLTGGVASELMRTLSAVPRVVALEARDVEGVRVWAIDESPETPLLWPDDETPLRSVPSVGATVGANGSDGDDAFPVVLIARTRGATARALGIVDRLLGQQDEKMPPTGFVDVGGALSSRVDLSPETARAMRKLLLARAPIVLGTGRAELAARTTAPDVLADDAPYVLAADGEPGVLPPPTRRISLGKKELLFVALGGLGRRMRALLPKGATALSASSTVARAGATVAEERAPDFVLGIALSSDGEARALSSSNFDAVLHLVSSRTAALPAIDDIDYRENHASHLQAAPGLVRISAADVTEVYLWQGTVGQTERIRIVRHAVVDTGPEAADAVAAVAASEEHRARTDQGLPARSTVDDNASHWTAKDLGIVRAALVRRALNAEIAITDPVEQPVRVEGAVPGALARAWLSSSTRVVNVRVRGQALRRVFDVLKLKSHAFAWVGADVAKATVSDRVIDPLEWYTVAVSPLVVARLADDGVFVSIPDGALESAPSLSDILETALTVGLAPELVATLLDEGDGRPTHAFIVEVRDLALSIAAHRIAGNEGMSLIRDSRLQALDYLTVGVNGRVAAFYDGPWAAAGAYGLSQFSRLTQVSRGGALTIQEARDVLLFESDARLKLNRLFHTDARYTPQPGVRLSYQTEWTPNLVTVDGVLTEQPRRSELRGLIGADLQPAPWLQSLRAGLIVENDFATPTAGALEFGAEAALAGQWNFGVTRVRLDGFMRGYLPDPERDTADDLGIVFQTIGRVDLPAFFDVNLGMFVDAYVATGKIPETHGPAVSVIVGASLTYGQRLKWLPLL